MSQLVDIVAIHESCRAKDNMQENIEIREKGEQQSLFLGGLVNPTDDRQLHLLQVLGSAGRQLVLGLVSPNSVHGRV